MEYYSAASLWSDNSELIYLTIAECSSSHMPSCTVRHEELDKEREELPQLGTTIKLADQKPEPDVLNTNDMLKALGANVTCLHEG